MKSPRPAGGVRIFLRMLFYTFLFIAVIGTRENLSAGTGPVSKTLARAFNQTLMASSKVGIGFALMSHRRGDQHTLVGKGAKQLYRLSHRGYITASRMNFYASL